MSFGFAEVDVYVRQVPLGGRQVDVYAWKDIRKVEVNAAKRHLLADLKRRIFSKGINWKQAAGKGFKGCLDNETGSFRFVSSLETIGFMA